MASPSTPHRRVTVSVIVVSYNTREKLRRCLAAIGEREETIVVDNGSTDGSAEMVAAEFPHVRLVEAGENLGFGRANNRGAALATGDLFLFLNSDCYAEPGAISILAGAFDRTDVAGAGGRLLNPDGTLQNSTANRMTLRAVLWEQTFLERLVPIYWNTSRLYREGVRLWGVGDTNGEYDDPKVFPTCDQAMGACLMCRREAFPGFDERFFLYMEDTMLCDAVRGVGRIAYVWNAVFTHELGASSRGEWWRGVARYNAGKELYFRITRGERAARICRGLNKFGALLRIVVKPRRAAGFWRVFREPRAESSRKSEGD